jgi:2-oxoglutarate ferredoxin oxidoreductase subunit alpha
MSQTEIQKATILFAGDSGDGMQLTGFQFSNTSAIHGNDLSTFPDFPAEIRAPAGTVSGVSGFKINFGSVEVYTPGGKADTLVAMNAAALIKNLDELKPRGIVVANVNGFDKRNLRLAKIDEQRDLLQEVKDSGHEVIKVEITKLTREALKESGLGVRDQDRAKNMFTLGLVYWLYNRDIQPSVDFLNRRFAKKPEVRDANLLVLKAGYHYGETAEIFSNRFQIQPAKLPPGKYRNVMGNEALAEGLLAASVKSGLNLFYAGYPITPASDILHELSKHKNFGVRTFQAEDEIAAVTSAIGASFGGALAVTASSGPGIALKMEGIGLAIMLELPLVVINVQRGGPSTGLPTKTEQSDLFQAIHGRNGEAPMAVLAACSPSDAFEVAFEACRIAVEHMTSVMVLSDGYIANGAEPWRFPSSDDLQEIDPPFAEWGSEEYLPYKRDEKGVRSWAIPGTAGLEHRLGGLEKQAETGNVSYDPDNHQQMVNERRNKIDNIAQFIPQQEIECGPSEGELLILGWGSTYGAIRTAVQKMSSAGISVAQAHLRYLNPFPTNLGELMSRYEKVLIPELNDGQLIHFIRDRFLIPAEGLHKIKGLPFLADEIEERALEILGQ